MRSVKLGLQRHARNVREHIKELVQQSLLGAIHQQPGVRDPVSFPATNS